MRPFLLSLLLALSSPAHAYTINGQYARLVSCELGLGPNFGPTGYYGTYDVNGSRYVVWFGQNFCPP